MVTRERAPESTLKKFWENLRCGLTWPDVFVGAVVTFVISALLVGFRYQSIPDFKVGEIANQEVRALQDFAYEDTQATEQKKAAVQASIPVVYDLRTDLIASLEKDISRNFSVSRAALAEVRIPQKGEIPAAERTRAAKIIEERLLKPLPPEVLDVLTKRRFSIELEGQVLKLMDGVLRDGILQDRAEFSKQQQRAGILLRDVSSGFERPLPDVYMARDLSLAREYLRQFHLEFSDLPARDRAVLISYLETLLLPTLIYNEQETANRRDATLSRTSPVVVQVKQGKTIVRSGEEVTQSMASQLQALRSMRNRRPLLYQFAGFLFFAAVFVYALWRYFFLHQKRHRKVRNHALLVVVVLIIVLALLRAGTMIADSLSERLSLNLEREPVNFYFAIPLVFGSLLVTLLVDLNLGLLYSLILSTLIGLFYGSVEIAAYFLMGSLAGIFSIRQYNDRAAVLKAGLMIGAAGACTLISLDLVRQAPFVLSTVFAKIGYSFGSALLTTSICSMLLPVFESTFKIVTNIRLLELSNLNAPILRRMSVESPGTYHHSLMVATLAEAAAETIGANPLLARVGAYYHDLGKVLKPEYYVENQPFGINKHENLSPSMSCLIIASHVKDGLELAKEARLPERIRDMIPQHHGTRIMTYFYQKAKEAANGKNQEVKEADYRYPGPKPQSKEAAVLMMSDSVEAASRTLDDPSPAQILGMINRLVDAVVSDGQLDECDITMREVNLVKESFFKVLTGIFHKRIDYPGYDFNQTGNEPLKPLSSPGPKQAKAV
jgi:putative nucleotidyltransferase with HDIG domain